MRAQSNKVKKLDAQDETPLTKVKRNIGEMYQIRLNTIRNDVEWSEHGENNFSKVNDNELYLQLEARRVKCSLKDVKTILGSEFPKKHNPVKEYFESLEYDFSKGSVIDETLNHLKVPDEQRERLLYQGKKWFVRAVRTALDEDYFNKQILTFVGEKQNTGKSTFCRWLCPPQLKEYYQEDVTTDKDGRIAITENLLITFDELAGLDKSERTALKTFISKSWIKDRLPYTEKAVRLPRIASFIANTNEWEIINDHTGSVRWLCFCIDDIDFSYKKNIDVNDLWAEAYHLLRSNKFPYEMSAAELDENERANRQFFVQSSEMDAIKTHFLPGESVELHFRTATDIMKLLKTFESDLKTSRVKVGKALTQLGFKKATKTLIPEGKTKGETVRGYLVKTNYDTPKDQF